MRSRTALVAAFTATTTLATIAGFTASAEAGSVQTGQSKTDPAGDVSGTSLDMVKVGMVKDGKTYRVTVRYVDLKKTLATRRMVSIAPNIGIGRDALLVSSRILELRTTPEGAVKAKYWDTTNGTQVVACPGFKAVPNYASDKVTYLVPKACIGPMNNALIDAVSWKNPPGEPWDTSTTSIPSGATQDELDDYLNWVSPVN